jgi:hypothetical protein
MLRSLYGQYVAIGGWVDFDRFLRSDAPGLAWDPDHLAFHRLVELYLDLFGGRVLVLPYELLRRDPRAFLEGLAHRLGTVVSEGVDPSLLNPSLSGWRLTTVRLWNRAFRRSRFDPNPILPLRGGSRLRDSLRGSARMRMEDGSAFAFAQRYMDSNRRLAKVCDLSGLGYPGVA